MNWIFLGLITISVLTAALTGTMPKLTEGTLASAKSAVELALGLIGQMTLWLGLVGVVREAGLLRSVANGLKPIMVRLFPEVPPDHPAMGAMIMNLAANVLGLGNAATPFGLKAMQELDKLNQRKGVSTNSMALFLAINTSGVAVLPLGVIATRAALGSHDAAGIVIPTLIATSCSTVFAVIACKLLERRPMFALEKYGPVTVDETKNKAPDAASLEKAEAMAAVAPKVEKWRSAVALSIVALVVFGMMRQTVIASGGCAANDGAWLCLGAVSPAQTQGAFDITRGFLSDWLLPLLILSMVTVGFTRQVKIYETFIASAKEGFQTVMAIIPFLVGMLVAIGMFRASGALEALVKALSPLLSPIGFPPEALPMALIRPLSGSGALGVMSDSIKAYGPDSFVGYLVSVLNGSTETTFYVLAVYYGAVQVKVLRHALLACLVADFAGPLGAFLACKLFFGTAPMVVTAATVAPK
ncbi:MAG: nucleoside recognition domain-containing protein [Myxococcaceae bacterium]